MKSISFPKMFNSGSTNVTKTDYEATLQNLKLLLASEKGELLGDPYFGTLIKRYIYDQNNNVLRDIIIDEIYTAVGTFMPQLQVNRKNIQVVQTDKATLTLTLKATNIVDFTVDTYNLVLFQLAEN